MLLHLHQSKKNSKLINVSNSFPQQKAAHSTHSHRTISMQFYDEFLAFKTQFSNFCPREWVDFREVLENNKASVSNSQLQRNAFMIL